MAFPDILVLRHGETEWNRAGRLQGALDSPLTDLGREQAARQNALLQAFGVAGRDWFVSPQGRARATAEIAAQGLAASAPAEDPRLREIEMGDWTGKSRAMLMAEAPHLFEAEGMAWYDHAPGGEGLTALADRTLDFLQALRGPAVIVTHGITSRVLRCHALGLPFEAFDRLEGGQGVVHHVAGGHSRRLG